VGSIPSPPLRSAHFRQAQPVAYLALAGEAQFRVRQCARGCAETGERDFLPGHEIRAIQARIRAHFGGSPLRFIQ
jgi:hypothetical protein